MVALVVLLVPSGVTPFLFNQKHEVLSRPALLSQVQMVWGDQRQRQHQHAAPPSAAAATPADLPPSLLPPPFLPPLSLCVSPHSSTSRSF